MLFRYLSIVSPVRAESVVLAASGAQERIPQAVWDTLISVTEPTVDSNRITSSESKQGSQVSQKKKQVGEHLNLPDGVKKFDQRQNEHEENG